MCFSRMRKFVLSQGWPGRRLVSLAGLSFVLLPAGSALAAGAASPVSASEQVRELLVASIGVGPGQALPDQAMVIQAAIDSNPTNTATACAGIVSYLGLVKAQAGKHVSTATAAVLTTDASTLAATLGC